MQIESNRPSLDDSERSVRNDAVWQVRVELAALYRLVALYRWDDLVFTHISARLPGHGGHFLINSFGMMFDEICASNLVMVDGNGDAVGGYTGEINRAGYVVHSAIHEARPDAMFVIHLHSLDGVAVASQIEGLLPLNQRSLAVIPRLRYHDYEGIATDVEERARLAADFCDGEMMILRNHGTLAIGTTAGEAWQNIYQLETACSMQVRALSAGREGVLLASVRAQEDVRRQVQTLRRSESSLTRLADTVWSAAVRQLRSRAAGYDQ
jgi:ribulose-5-phosphate 4-epimerase/fuculose-1-phosphate aldolase